MKICNRCKKEKKLEEFVKDNRRKDGRSTLCKECKRESDRKRYHERKNDPKYHKKKLEHGKKYRETHKKQLQEKAFIYNSKPEVIERKSMWYRDNIKKGKRKIDNMFTGAKNRALEKQIPFNIEKSDIIPIDVCPILQIPLNWEGGPRDRNTPSLDKIIPKLGYVKGNIQIISWLANMMKSEASEKELLTFSNNINKYMKNKEIVRTAGNEKSVEVEDKEPLR